MGSQIDDDAKQCKDAWQKGYEFGRSEAMHEMCGRVAGAPIAHQSDGEAFWTYRLQRVEGGEYD